MECIAIILAIIVLYMVTDPELPLGSFGKWVVGGISLIVLILGGCYYIKEIWFPPAPLPASIPLKFDLKPEDSTSTLTETVRLMPTMPFQGIPTKVINCTNTEICGDTTNVTCNGPMDNCQGVIFNTTLGG